MGCLLLSMHFGGAVGAVFGAPGTGDVAGAAERAARMSLGWKTPLFQLQLCRENRVAEIFADECVGDGLWADAVFSIIQKEAVAVRVVAAELDQPLDVARLFILQRTFPAVLSHVQSKFLGSLLSFFLPSHFATDILLRTVTKASQTQKRHQLFKASAFWSIQGIKLSDCSNYLSVNRTYDRKIENRVTFSIS